MTTGGRGMAGGGGGQDYGGPPLRPGGFPLFVSRRLLSARIGPELSAASVIQPVMTGVGVFTFLAGALYMPTLAPTRVEMILMMLLLATAAMLCHAVGQLAVIAERLERRGPSPD